jgi:hypothetical protein
LLSTPANLTTVKTHIQTFIYIPVFFQSIQNTSLWLNLSGSWQPVAYNTSAIMNATANTLTYTFLSSNVWSWTVAGYNTTTLIYAPENRTLTTELNPTYSNPLISSVVNGTSCTFSLDWQDDYALSFGILENNASGILHNQTAISLSGTSVTFSDTSSLPLSVGVVVAYRFYANDTANLWNSTQTYYLTTQSSPASSPSQFKSFLLIPISLLVLMPLIFMLLAIFYLKNVTLVIGMLVTFVLLFFVAMYYYSMVT